jgi:carbamoyl-phosphate synthase large subunit
MPRNNDLKKILLIGSGPIVIGQGCEFDYSGVQACKALREEGYTVVLVNSNPATIMTDPEFADRTYIEPITAEVIEAIIEREKPDAILPTMGGQTALNAAMELNRNGALARHSVKLIGANAQAIAKGEDRQLFKEAMLRIGLDVPRSGIAKSVDDAEKVAGNIGSFPLIIRPAFTLGGSGGGIAYNYDELAEIAARGLAMSPVSEVLIEESLVGWKEFEMEVMRDRADNCVVVCSIENFDPMGVHTGDSITVAPVQTLTDKEYQMMRDAAFAVIREIGVETGGSNIQFAVNPENGRMVVIEMNPRVSRSSALASKATGFPIAKIAAKLAVGYTLDEIPNDITRETPASFEPTIDYCVVKVPRFTFEKFPQADSTLTTQMKSVGEAMAIGRTFKEALQKALRSLEIKRFGIIGDGNDQPADEQTLRLKLAIPNAERIFYIAQAFANGMAVDDVFELTRIDRWFLRNIEQIVHEARALRDSRPRLSGQAAVPAAADNNANIRQAGGPSAMTGATPVFRAFDPLGSSEITSRQREETAGATPACPTDRMSAPQIRRAKKLGFSDRQLAIAHSTTDQEIRAYRKSLGVMPTYRLVDTCAAEFEAYTPYYYSTYGSENERRESGKRKIMILGSGPNRIGQGIEFDYCCVHAAFALRELGFETIMVNSNPETVSTDYDTSDKLYFEPLTLEDVLNIYEQEKPEGVVVQFGGQTPLNLADGLKAAGVPILGTQPESIETAEDRKLFAAMLDKLGLRQTPSGSATSVKEAVKIAEQIGYPVLVRPSFVLGGRGMELVYNAQDLQRYVEVAIALEDSRPRLSGQATVPAAGEKGEREHTRQAGRPSALTDETPVFRPVLIDRFLEDAMEVDVDCISDGETTVIGAIMEHIEQAGIHSGDSACVIPTFSLTRNVLAEISHATKAMAQELKVRGLMNVQFAVKGQDVYVLEVNPRASRTVPFVSKAIGVPLAKLAAKVMVGKTLRELGFIREIVPKHFSVKEAVFPFLRYQGQDIALGPEMKSTGEVMGIDEDLGLAYAKSQMAAPPPLPRSGNIFVSVKDSDKASVVSVVREFVTLGFGIIATAGTAATLEAARVPVTRVFKLREGRPNVLDRVKNGEINFIINTPSGKIPREDEVTIRNAAIARKIPIMTTLRAAQASVHGIRSLQKNKLRVRSLQEYHGK